MIFSSGEFAGSPLGLCQSTPPAAMDIGIELSFDVWMPVKPRVGSCGPWWCARHLDCPGENSDGYVIQTGTLSDGSISQTSHKLNRKNTCQWNGWWNPNNGTERNCKEGSPTAKVRCKIFGISLCPLVVLISIECSDLLGLSERISPCSRGVRRSRWSKASWLDPSQVMHISCSTSQRNLVK